MKVTSSLREQISNKDGSGVEKDRSGVEASIVQALSIKPVDIPETPGQLLRMKMGLLDVKNDIVGQETELLDPQLLDGNFTLKPVANSSIESGVESTPTNFLTSLASFLSNLTLKKTPSKKLVVNKNEDPVDPRNTIKRNIFGSTISILRGIRAKFDPLDEIGPVKDLMALESNVAAMSNVEEPKK